MSWAAVGTLAPAAEAAAPASQVADDSADEPPGYVPARTYTTDAFPQGASGQNWSTAQDHRGIVYAANASGVLAYDGAEWTLIPTEQESLVRTVVADSDGDIHVGAYNEIGTIASDSIGAFRYESLTEHIDPADREFGHVFHGVATDEAVYFHSAKTIFEWDGRSMTSWTAPDTTEFGKIFAVRDTVYATELGAGLSRLVDGQWELVPGTESFAENGLYAVLPHEEGLLVATHSNELFLVGDDASAEPFEAEAAPFLDDGDIYDGVQLPDGTYALATLRGGVIQMDADGRTIRHIDQSAGLPSDDVKHLFVDREAGLWAATELGIARLDVISSITTYDDRNGLEGAGMALARHEGALHVGTSAGVQRLERRARADGRVEAHLAPVADFRAQVFDLISTEHGLLAATEWGVVHLTNGEYRTIRSGLAALSLHQAPEDNDRVYVGYEDGIGAVEWNAGGNAWEEGASVPEFDEEVFFLESDTYDRLWASSAHGGLWYLDRGDALDDAPEVHQVVAEGDAPGHLYRLQRSAEGLHIVTPDGIARPASEGASEGPLPEVATWADAVPAAEGSVLDLQAAPDGDFWLYADSGIFWLRPGAADGYDVERPFAAFDVLSPAASWAESGGQLWITDEQELMQHMPRATEHDAPPRHALLRSVHTDDGDSLLARNYSSAEVAADNPVLELSPSQNALQFDYTVPTYEGDAAVEYRYRLLGFEDEWSSWSEDSRKEYTNLPAGDLAFEVQARVDGDWHSESVVFPFNVRPSWYQTIWAYLIFGAVGLGLIFGVVRWRSAHLKARARKLESMVAQRTAEVQEQARTLEAYNHELRQTNEALQTALDQKSELLGIAAHDLKNPLFGIRGISEMLLEREDLGDEPKEKIQLIHESSVETLELINDLLESAAASSGQIDLNMEVMDMGAVAEWVVHSFRQQAEHKNQTLTYRPPERAMPVEADERKLREAMSNLLSNAVKYTPKGGTIEVTVTHFEDEIHFSVADTGPGLSESEQQNVFAPFQRLSPEPTDGEGSSGLGLYIVKQLVELHEGRVWVESTPGDGSTFTLALPVVPPKREQRSSGDHPSGAQHEYADLST